jgi:Glycosyltransferase
MKILYCSCLCSDTVFQKLFETSIHKPGIAEQKFHKLLCSGLLGLGKNSIEMLSAIPVTHEENKKLVWNYRKEIINNNLTFRYPPFINLPFIKRICIFFFSFFYCLYWMITGNKSEKVLICDTLKISVSVAAWLASKITGTASVAIVTDLPEHLDHSGSTNSSKLNLFTKICLYFMSRYNMYIILTEQMNNLINVNKMPYVVIEGMVDISMSEVSNCLENKAKERIIIYAGGLYERFGVKKLIEAFSILPFEDVRLWLYGSGDMEQQIKEYEKLDIRIKYFGVVPNSNVVNEEIRAALLVNPRPSDEEFTKYSFPSKNMEYMVSGTPLLTTLLPGMPEEYKQYVYLFTDESVDGMAKTLQEILSLSREELHYKGQEAKNFVMRKKSNVEQAKKVQELVSTSLKYRV